MLDWSTVVGLLNAIVPLYLCIALGYASSKLRILPHEVTYAGIAGLVNKFSFPILIFRMICTNDPYHMDLKLVGADTAYKVSLLFGLGVYCFCRPTHQTLAWASTFFNLATMPNSVFLGPPLLTSLFPGSTKFIDTLIFTQFSLWSSVCVLILEIHKAVYESSADFEAKKKIDTDHYNYSKEFRGMKDAFSTDDWQGFSLSAKDLLQNGAIKDLEQVVVADDSSVKIPQDPLPKFNAVKIRKKKFQVGKKIARTVLVKFLSNPLVWGSIGGFIYSLLNFRFNQGKPLPPILLSWVNLLANGTLGICMFLLGMNMGVAPVLLACGLPKALMGVGVRFVFAPASMALASYAFGLRGNVFRFAVMQAMVPQAVASFVWASQYNVHVDILSTAVWFQTAIFLPFVIALDKLVSIGS